MGSATINNYKEIVADPNSLTPIHMGDQTGDAYYTGSHYEGGNLDIQTGEMLPGEASDLVPEEFFFEFFP